MRKIIPLLALTAMLVVLASGPAFASVVFFDDFESENPLGIWFEPDWGGKYVRNYTSFDNWTVTSGSVDLYEDEADYFNLGGGKYVDLAGSDPSFNGPGTLTSNAIKITETGTYELSFLLAGNRRSDPLDTVIVSVDVTGVDSWEIRSDTDIGYLDGFTLFSYMFDLSTTDSIVLAFAAGGDFDKDGFILDNVKLAMVPIPGAVILFSSGLIGLLCVRRKLR